AAALAATFLSLALLGAVPAPNKALNDLFEREFANELVEHPELATLVGVPGFDDKLTDRSPQAVARRKAHTKDVLAELGRYDPASLSTQDRISRELALETFTMRDRENALYGDLPFGASEDGWMPASTMNGPQMTMAFLTRAARFATVADYENYLKRLAAVPAMLEQRQAQMRAGMRSGWMPPHEAMVRVPPMYIVFAGADVTASPLWRPFAKFPADVPAADQARLAASAKSVLAERVHPAFAAFKRFLEDDYLPATRKDLAASKLPAGPAYYALRVREMTTLPLDPAAIHETGKSEVARIRKAMDEVIASTGFKGTFAQFLEFIRTDPRFFFKTPEARLMAYRDIAKRADAELPKLFAELPRLPYGVRAMEAYEGDNADHYSPGAIDGTRAGFFEANVNNLTKRPSHEMESTLLHEAVPGHHLQNARAQELTGLPTFRRALWYVAYGEGWALYAESLGYEMGFYTDPYSRFGALSAEMLRACRLVVDTGIHSMGWSREQAIRYLADNSGVHEDFAAAEVDRYIVLPGQALGYKVGELKIKALRAKAKAALGERFDLRRFHNAVLDDGALPLTVLEARIDEWIRKETR
ncbi:MAG: DUF885 domain-containing protein, partial [Usitatibacter sp.]